MKEAEAATRELKARSSLDGIRFSGLGFRV